jgi:hypothetical protein
MPLLGSRGAASLTGFGGLAKLGYLLRNSLRIRASNSAYLSRTPASASNRRTWTWSAWVKRGALSYGEATLFNAGTTGIGTNDTGFYGIRFTSGDQLDLSTGVTNTRRTTQVFRDPAAWYHIVFAADTTQATSTERLKLYVNGVQVTAFNSSAYPSQNTDGFINQAQAHEIGRLVTNNGYLMDGYMTECNFIDGQALTPNSFGTFNSFGVWQPIVYGGSYGTNGFYLPMTISSSSVSTDYLIVAGGGAGGGEVGGGGGAGGMLTGTTTITPNTSYTVTVGAGGTGNTTVGNNGGNSVFGTLTTAVGGGAGGTSAGAGSGVATNGGSGGGSGGFGTAIGTGTSGQGNSGGVSGAVNGAGAPNYPGGGGGGKTSAGGAATPTVVGAGGAGASSSITGSAVTYATGGAGGLYNTGNINGVAGTANTGNGGNGAYANSAGPVGGTGGSGIVVVSYAAPQKFVGGTVTTFSSNIIHTFTASGTLTPIGLDYSPQNNNWTPNNISLTTGSTYDSMTDVPTLTSATAANYCVVNPLMFRLSNTPGATISNGNLTSTHTPTAYGSYVWGTVGVSSGKWYWEITATTVAGSNGFGIDTGGMQNSSTAGAIWYLQNGTKTVFGSSSAYGASWTSGDVIGVALDMNAGTLTYYKNNTSQGVAATGLTGTFLPFALGESSAVFNWNFGQQPFVYTPPSGFLALNTFNL